MNTILGVVVGIAIGSVFAGLFWDKKLLYRFLYVCLIGGVLITLNITGVLSSTFTFAWILGIGLGVLVVRVFTYFRKSRPSQR